MACLSVIVLLDMISSIQISDFSISLLVTIGIRFFAFIMFLVMTIRQRESKHFIISAAWFIYIIGPIVVLTSTDMASGFSKPSFVFSALCATGLLVFGLVLYIYNLKAKFVAVITLSITAAAAVFTIILSAGQTTITSLIQFLFIFLCFAFVLFNKKSFRYEKSSLSFVWFIITIVLALVQSLGFNLFLDDVAISVKLILTALINLSFMEFLIFLDWEQIQKEYKTSLKQKEILLQEVHHRVKNNLSIINSILRLQESHIDDEDKIELLQSLETRLSTMAMVHDQLYRSSSKKVVDFSLYMIELTDYLASCLSLPESSVVIERDIQPLNLDINKMIPCGMLVNEIVTNSFKHAFSGIKLPVLSIQTKMDDNGNCIIRIADNGRGMDDSETQEAKSTTGRVIISALVEQLEAHVQINNIGGTEYIISIKSNEKQKNG